MSFIDNLLCINRSSGVKRETSELDWLESSTRVRGFYAWNKKQKTYSATRSSKIASASEVASMPLLIHSVIGFTMVDGNKGEPVLAVAPFADTTRFVCEFGLDLG